MGLPWCASRWPSCSTTPEHLDAKLRTQMRSEIARGPPQARDHGIYVTHDQVEA